MTHSTGAFSWNELMPERVSNLPRGYHAYEAIREKIEKEVYRFAKITTLSGRINYLIGISPEELSIIAQAGRQDAVDLVFFGSRVSGPRCRQKTFNKVLDLALSLTETTRRATPTYPAVKGVELDKRFIREMGINDPRTSDLGVVLINRPGYSFDRVAAIAHDMEIRFRSLGAFPIKVFPAIDGTSFESVPDFIGFGRDYLKGRLPPNADFSDREIEEAYAEICFALRFDSDNQELISS